MDRSVNFGKIITAGRDQFAVGFTFWRAAIPNLTRPRAGGGDRLLRVGLGAAAAVCLRSRPACGRGGLQLPRITVGPDGSVTVKNAVPCCPA
jgi:hypothetical protein